MPKHVDKTGTIKYTNDAGKLHREDGPAVEYTDGTKIWCLNGEPHREDGPAIEHADGTVEWYLNGKPHRKDDPAIEDRRVEWMQNDKKISADEVDHMFLGLGKKSVSPQQAMFGFGKRPVGQFLLTIYIIVGGCFAFPVFISYIYAGFYIMWQLGWAIFSWAGFFAILLNVFMLALAPPFKAVFWLPSLILWFYSDQDNFWRWLAPGFFVSVGGS